MSLHLTATAPVKTEPRLVRLPTDMLVTVREYAAAKQAKKEAESAARAADNVIKSTMAAIIAKMDGQVTAVCEHAVIVLKTTADSKAALTMKDGSKTPWERVSGLTIGNQYVAREDVDTIYGGRSGSTSLDVSGAL